jgi:hypothetical protein
MLFDGTILRDLPIRRRKAPLGRGQAGTGASVNEAERFCLRALNWWLLFSGMKKKARGAFRPLVSKILSQMLTSIRSVRPMSKHAQNKRPAVVVFGAVALALAGCSGSSNDARDEIAVRPIPSFAVTNARSQQLFAQSVNMNTTSFARLPVTGTARYTGAASYVDSNTSEVLQDGTFPGYETFIVNNPDYVSQVRMTADFAGDSVSGSMDSFRDNNNKASFIDMTFGGQILESGSRTAAFEGTLSGTREIQVEPGKIEVKSFSGTIAGNFLGGQGDTVQGTLAVKKGFTGDQLGSVFGVFTAEQ